MRLIRPFLLLPLLAFTLQGCVAAVIPLAAAGAMSTAVRDNPKTPEAETVSSAPAASQVAMAAPETAEKGAASRPVEAELLPETQEAMRRAGLMPGTQLVVVEGLADLPPSTATAADPRLDATYTAFADYALEIAGLDPITDELRQSALLARPGVLTAERAPCRFVGNAVLIDLDPKAGQFDTSTPMLRPALAEALTKLREADVEIVWGTALTADRAGDVRNWLARSNLDPEREDRLLLLRYPEDRKQTRREEASTERCLIAMLGDERADFDELFDYLKNPDAAIGLDAMLGKGWFLAPVSQPTPNTEGLEQ